MSKTGFSRGLGNEALEQVITFLNQDRHKQIKDNLGKYQLCIRNDYINIYSDGCSLIKYCPNAKKNMLMVHYKYLDSQGNNRSEKSPYISLDVGKEVSFTPERIKSDYASGEKKEIAKYLEAQKNIGGFLLLDLEVAFIRERDAQEITKRKFVADRIDMACIYLKDREPILRLIEVKLTNDARLKSDQAVNPYKEPEIMTQMEHYLTFINREKNKIRDSYKKIAQNYLELIKQEIIPKNYFSSIDGLSPIEILQGFANNPQIEAKPYLLLLVKTDLKRGRNKQNHWKKLLELFDNKYPKPELWQTEQCK